MRRVGSDDPFQTGYLLGFQPWEDALKKQREMKQTTIWQLKMQIGRSSMKGEVSEKKMPKKSS